MRTLRVGERDVDGGYALLLAGMLAASAYFSGWTRRKPNPGNLPSALTARDWRGPRQQAVRHAARLEGRERFPAYGGKATTRATILYVLSMLARQPELERTARGRKGDLQWENIYGP